MKTTPLTIIHQDLGAKMMPFAGYLMPVSYNGIKEEHKCVRNSVGLFDISHMGEFLVKGEGAFKLIQQLTSNDVSKLKEGDIQYSCFPNKEGGIIDDLLVYRMPDTDGFSSFMLVVNASNIDKDWNWIESHNSFGATLENISDNAALLAVQGPKAVEVLKKLTDIDLDAIKYYNFEIGKIAGIGNTVISATGYTGSGGFELYIHNEHAAKLWKAIMEAGDEFGIQAIGLGARDTLRLEMGYCLYGNDINDNTSPIEAGLGWITKVKKGEFTSSKTFTQQKKEGVKNKLVGFKAQSKRIPRHGYKIEDTEGNTIGEVTSGTLSPSLNIPVGLGYVPKSFAKPGTEICINIRGRKESALVVKLPFYDSKVK